MAEDTTKKRRLKKVETVRERAEKASSDKTPRRLRVNTKDATKPFKAVARIGRKEYHPLRLPDNKLGRVLNRRARLVPRYFTEAWDELRQVSWPGRRETIKLTIAVFVFAIIFGGFVALLDFGLDKVFRSLILT